MLIGRLSVSFVDLYQHTQRTQIVYKNLNVHDNTHIVNVFYVKSGTKTVNKITDMQDFY